MFRAAPGNTDAGPLIVGVVGLARAIDGVFGDFLDWCLYAPSTVAGTPAGASFALCRPDIAPEDLVGRTPSVSWNRIDYEDLHDAVHGRPVEADAIDETPRLAPDE